MSRSVLFIRLTLSCHFWIFQNPRIQKGQKALEGSQKLKVSENRKSSILVGEIMVSINNMYGVEISFGHLFKSYLRVRAYYRTVVGLSSLEMLGG